MVRLELLYSDHVGHFDALDRGGGMKNLEAQSWPGDFLGELMVLSNDVVQIFHTQDFNLLLGSRERQSHIYLFKARQISPTFCRS
mgnify:CR=1 FL=1